MNRTILITGATDGIGLALARGYAAESARLVLVGRRARADLDDPLFTDETYCRVDLGDTDCAEQISAWLDARKITSLDLLINNAALGYVGAVGEQPASSIRTLEAVNLRAPIAITHRLLARVEQAAGRVVFIGSVASVLPSPTYAVYSATKAALDAFVRSLQVELSATDSPARALMVHPGATRTGMHAKTGVTREQLDWTKFTPAETVAAQIAAQIDGSRRTAAVGLTNNLAYQSLRRWPEPLEWAMHRQGTKRMYRQGERHCVITGGADGIGRALVLAFGAAGYRITAIDRDPEQSMRTQAELINSGGRGRFLMADLRDEDDLAHVLRTLAERPPIDVVIHNAGISAAGLFARLPLDGQLAVLDVNFLAPLLLTQGVLAGGLLTDEATLVFISSLSHFAGYPGAAVYAASKAGVASYARSLAVALAPAGQRTLTIYPGPTRTAHARRYSPDNSREAKRMSPERLAEQILFAVSRGKRQLIPGPANEGFALAGRLFPSLTDAIMRKTMLEKIIAQEATESSESA